MLKKIIPLLLFTLLIYGAFHTINNVSAQDSATTCESYIVRSGDTLSRIARRYDDVSLSELLSANDLTLTSIIRIGRTLCIPQPIALEANGCLDYTVRSGDTIARIAGRYDEVSISALLSANNLRLSSVIRVGQTLCIPLGEGGPAETPTPRPTVAPTVTDDSNADSNSDDNADVDKVCEEHIIRIGDSLSRLAARYDISLSTLLQANDLRLTSVIRVGDKVCIPQPQFAPLRLMTFTPTSESSTPTATPAPTTSTTETTTSCETYTVRSGDTLSRIARRYDDVSLSELMSANDLTLTSIIRVGQRLCIPAESTVSTAVTRTIEPISPTEPAATRTIEPIPTTDPTPRPTNTPPATRTVEPIVTSEPTTQPTDESIFEPTIRPIDTNTPTPEPTDTPAPTNTPARTVEPIPTAVPPSQSGGLYLSSPEQFAAQSRNPLTGEVVSAANLNRRPILCKISNYPKRYVLPQSGLNAADLVFEHFAEGNITRFSALFYGETPSRMGPVRSARLIDLELPLMYDASLCFSGGSSGQGANEGVQDKLRDVSFAERVMFPSAPGVYYRSGEDKPLEHTFYARPNDAWTYLSSQGQNRAPNFTSYMTFSEDVPASANVSKISIKYGQGDLVQWTYDPAIDKYRRTANGTTITDALDGAQVTASNVVVLYAPHYLDRNICETQGATQCNSFSTEIQIWGGGFAQFFRNGRQIDGTWYRPNRATNGQMFTFEIDSGDQVGQVMPLAVGNTWFQVVPYDEYLTTTITVE